MRTETILVTKADTTLSALLARHYRGVFGGVVETVLALNQDLAREGAHLPVGRRIVVPTASAMREAQGPAIAVVDIFA